MFRAHTITCRTIECGLASHRPVVLRWDSLRESVQVNWIEKATRPASDILFGPKATFTWDIWTAQMLAFANTFGVSDTSLFGDKKSCKAFSYNSEELWDGWLVGAEVAIRATSGAAFDIKQGSLHQALASRERANA